jgi:signal transduction histidine kinase
MTTFADFGAVRMIAQNLVQNAWKYTRNKKKPVIEIGCFENESKETVFFVRDNGIGFDSEIADHLFQPFRRGHADSRIDGMGIGLSVVKRAVERHGGRVWAESQPGKGASFFFTLNNNS